MSGSNEPLFSLFDLGVSIHNLNLQSEKRLGISLGQWCFLKKLIDMPATSAHAFANAVGVHPSTLTQALKRLHARNYVFITEDPKDSRKKLISITREGKDALERADKILETHSKGLNAIGSELSKIRGHLKNHLAEL